MDKQLKFKVQRYKHTHLIILLHKKLDKAIQKGEDLAVKVSNLVAEYNLALEDGPLLGYMSDEQGNLCIVELFQTGPDGKLLNLADATVIKIENYS